MIQPDTFVRKEGKLVVLLAENPFKDASQECTHSSDEEHASDEGGCRGGRGPGPSGGEVGSVAILAWLGTEESAPHEVAAERRETQDKGREAETGRVSEALSEGELSEARRERGRREPKCGPPWLGRLWP